MKAIKLKKPSFSTFFFILLGLVLLAYALSVIVMLAWAGITSIKMNVEFMENAYKWPKYPTFENYKLVLSQMMIPVTQNGMEGHVTIVAMAKYSIFYSVGSAFCATIVPCFTAYAVARFNFKFNSVIINIVIITMALPIVGSLPSELQMAKALGFYDSILGNCLMKANFLGMYTLIFYSTFKSFSKDYAEAALVDGANEFTIMFKIMIPLVLNIIGMIFLLKFIDFWNDYSTPMIFMPNYPTMAYGLLQFNLSTNNATSFLVVKIAACVILMIPILILFLLFKNKLIGNLTLGGIKG